MAGAKGVPVEQEAATDEDDGLEGWAFKRDYWVDARGFARFVVRVPRAAAALDMKPGQLREQLRNGTFPGRKDAGQEWIVRVRDISAHLGLDDDLEWAKAADPMKKQEARSRA